MSHLIAAWLALWTRLAELGDGLVALLRVAGIGLAALLSGQAGSLKQQLTSPHGLRLAFAALRAFVPTLSFRKKLITCYENAGTALVTRYDDVRQVLQRDADFEVVYAPRMIEVTAGHNFFLGMQDSAAYTRDVSNMRLAVRRDDVGQVVLPFAQACAERLVQGSPGQIDVPPALSLRVPAQLLGCYFGTPGPSERELIEWTTVAFWYLFSDLNADPQVAARSRVAAAGLRDYLDGAIRGRKAGLTEGAAAGDVVLDRCLAMQRAGLPGMDDLGIRNNLIGLIIGAVPTTSTAAVQALDQLLDRPDALAGARRAAQADDDELLARFVFEALRFNPLSPVIYRRAVRDTVISPGTLRALRVPKSTMVLASNLSAMFDRRKVADPANFRTDRPWDNYLLWGDSLHRCFGAHINRAVIPAILKPLLKQERLRRAPGADGQIDRDGTPFPVHFRVQY